MLTFLFSISWAWNAASSAFYEAFGQESLKAIDQALKELEGAKSSTTVQAYKGALLMKKANYVKGAASKLDFFRKGRKLLDAAVNSDPSNAEYRFIRLTIQENAPKILRYNKNIAEDKRILVAGYKELHANTRSYVLDYARDSGQLQVSDLR